MAVAKKVTRLAGDDANLKEGINEPPDTKKVLIAVAQLQDTVNELISRVNAAVADFNTHVHSGVTVGAGNSGAKTSAATPAVQGVAVAATSLFVPPAS